MSPSRPFILRPVATSLMMAAILLAGMVAYTQLPVSALPQVDYPTIQVVTFYPGASPHVMATTVTAPLERQFGQIQGLSQMTSTSSGGSSVIVLQFNLDLNIDVAEQEVQSAINAAQSYLPSNLPVPPVYNKANPADAPVLTLAITSATMPLPLVQDLVDTRLSPKLSQLSGVGLVSISGGQKPAVRIQANPAALSSYGLNLEDLRTALTQTSVNGAKGNFDGPNQNYQINANDQLLTSTDYHSVVVAYRNNAPVFLKDVAQVVDGVENNKLAAWMNQTPAVIVNIQRQPGANTISVVKGIKALLPQLLSNLPASVQVTRLTDLTTAIHSSVADVEFELMLTTALVVLVIFLFLRSLSATIIPSVAVPLSLVGTFGVMYLLDYSLDNLSLMALAISTGFVVDDAIVVLENITRYLEQGMGPVEAAFRGAREIGFTVLSMSTSLIAVFIPLLLMGGIVGRLFREFAVTLSIAITVSLLVSLTTTPTMCAKLLRPLHEDKHGRIYRFSEKVFDTILNIYKHSLQWVLRFQPAVLLITLATIAVSVYLYIIVPKGFFPQQDTGRVQGSVQAAQDISFDAMKEKMTQFVNLVMQDPAVETIVGFAGGNTSSNQGRMFITLKPIEQRKISADQVIGRLRRKLAVVPGATLFMQSAQDLTIGGRQSQAQFQYTLQGEHLSELNEWAPRLLQKLRSMPQLRDVNTDQQDKGLEATVVIDRDTAGRLGVAAADIDNALYDAFGQRQVSIMYRQLNQYHVVMEVAPEYSRSPDALQHIYVRDANGTAVPLSSFAHFGPSNTPLAVSHQGQYPSVTLSFNLAPGVALGQATELVDQAERSIGFPATVTGSFQGTAAAFQSSQSNQWILILAALATVYIVLGMLYESYIHPITILSTLPSAGVGALLALLIAHDELNVIGLIGIILLIGLVKKNAIMMIDFALETERTKGKNSRDSIYEACVLRFRPIMMTTMAALLGGLPLALGTGTGSEMRRPLGITIVGGLIVSQALTLFTTPVVYIYLDRFRLWIKGIKGGQHSQALLPTGSD